MNDVLLFGIFSPLGLRLKNIALAASTASNVRKEPPECQSSVERI